MKKSDGRAIFAPVFFSFGCCFCVFVRPDDVKRWLLVRLFTAVFARARRFLFLGAASAKKALTFSKKKTAQNSPSLSARRTCAKTKPDCCKIVQG